MRKIPLLYKTLIVFFVLSFSIYLAITTSSDSNLQIMVAKFGYLGIFLFSIVSGFNVLVPIPAVAFTPTFVASGLNFWTIICIMTLGLTVGDLIGYFIGRVGKDVVKETGIHSKLFEKLFAIKNKFPRVPYFLVFLFASFVPFPNEILIIPLGFLGYHARYLLPAFFAGNIIFNIIYGYAGVALIELL